MMLAQTFMMYYEGRAWRAPPPDNPDPQEVHRGILRLFNDDPMSLYSIYAVAKAGQAQGKSVGQWFGPSTMAHVIKAMVTEWHSRLFSVYVSNESTIYRKQLLELARKGDPKKPGTGASPEASTCEGLWQPVLIILPLRLGLEKLNRVYKPSLLRVFSWPQCVGMMGGKPSMSFYFIGAQDENLFYLDPHTTRPVESMQSAFNTEHYQCSQIRKMKLDDIDPCIAVCLFCKCEEDFHDLCARQEELSGTLQVEPIFVVEDDEPNYEEMACVQAMMSGDLDEDEEDDFVLM